MQELWGSISQPLRFLLVGAINTLNGYILILISQYFLGPYLCPQVIFIVTFLFASIPAYFAMRFLVFKIPGNYFLQYIRHVTSSLLSVAGGATCVYISIDYYSLSPYFGQIFGVTTSALLSYVGLKYFAFSKTSFRCNDFHDDSPTLTKK